MTQPLNSDVNAGQHRNHRYRSNHENQAYHRPDILWHVKEIIESGCHLLCPETERCCEPEEPSKDCKRINNVSRPAPNPLSKDRIECGADSQG